MNKLEIVVRIPPDKFKEWMSSMQFVDLTDRKMLEMLNEDTPGGYVLLSLGRHFDI